MKKAELIENTNIINKIVNNLKDSLSIYELKRKTYLNQYEFFTYDKIPYLLTLDNCENMVLMIAEINIKNNYLDTTLISSIKSHIHTHNITTIKIVPYYIVIVSEYRLYFINIKQKIENNLLLINYIDLKYEFKQKHYPKTFNWPIIKYLEDNKYLILFNKSIYFIQLTNEAISNTSGNLFISLQGIYSAKVIKKNYFKQNTFSDVIFYNNLLYLAETNGDICIFNDKFEFIKLIYGFTKSPIVNMLMRDETILIIHSNSQLELLELKNDKRKVSQRSLLQNKFNNSINCHHLEYILCLINEQDDYVIYYKNKILKSFDKVIIS
jgi:hypothetical protein